MSSPEWRSAEDREMHLMHFYYRLHNDCGGSLVDKTKAWGVSGTYCLFNCQASYHTFVLNLCFGCRPVSYICRVSRYLCCSYAQKKFNAFFLLWKWLKKLDEMCLSVFLITNMSTLGEDFFLRAMFTHARHLDKNIFRETCWIHCVWKLQHLCTSFNLKFVCMYSTGWYISPPGHVSISPTQ